MKQTEVRLKVADRVALQTFGGKGLDLAREVNPAHVLMALDSKVPGAVICQVLGLSRTVVWRPRAAWSEESLPPGLALEPNLGFLVGFPSAIGPQAFRLHVTNGAQTASDAITLTVTNPVLLPIETLPSAVQNRP